MHPLIEEICRARADNLQPSAFRRWQQKLREEIQPRLDLADELEAERDRAAKASGNRKASPKATEVPA